MAEGSLKSPLQQGIENSAIDYYDIMVVGRTGMGKTTTVDKLLIASLPGQQPEASTEGVEPETNFEHGTMTCGEMVMWLIADKDFDLERVSTRLKNLTFFKSLKEPHRELNNAQEAGMHVYKSTQQPELLSNELTRIRVLDVPGFFGRDPSSDDANLEERMANIQKSDLATMRKVLRIKTAHNFKFNRIVYFLPERGSLKRTSQHLITEIAIMEKYFGSSIFDSMVAVATFPPDVYQHIPDDNRNLFKNPQCEETEEHLQEALRDAFKSDPPKPPIVFISLFDTCEVILEKIRMAEVKQDHVDLVFSNSICARCSIMIIQEGKAGSQVLSGKYPNQLGEVPLEETKCHPLIVPKYSKVKRVLGGIAHLITFRRFVGRWPNFESSDEWCVSCEKTAKDPGCMIIGSKFPVGKEEIIVDHTSIVEPCHITLQEEQDQEPAKKE